jgi:hypothetical protein
MKPCYKTVCETKMVTKCVDRGHWECREEYSAWKAFCNHLGSIHSDPCCNPCPPSNCVSRKCWVPCMVQEQCPVTCSRRVCEMVATTVKVQTCRTEIREEKVKVCVTKCIPETRVEKYTVCKQIQVPYECTRTVCVQVPCEEMVTCTRMVARTVLKEVPCNTGCNDCCNPCGGGHFGLFHGASLFRGCGCGGCGTGCGSCGGGCNSGCGGLFHGCNLFSGCMARPSCGCGCN